MQTQTQAPTAVPSVAVHLQAQRFDEWMSKIRSAVRFDMHPMDSLRRETPLGTLRLELCEADYRGGAYVQAVLEEESAPGEQSAPNEGNAPEDGSEPKWTSRPIYRIGQGTATVIGTGEDRLELVVRRE